MSSQPKVKPSQPMVKPSQPKVKPSLPKVKPSQPKVKPSQPKVKPSQSKIKPYQADHMPTVYLPSLMRIHFTSTRTTELTRTGVSLLTILIYRFFKRTLTVIFCVSIKPEVSEIYDILVLKIYNTFFQFFTVV
jgi:hypothetical protein